MICGATSLLSTKAGVVGEVLDSPGATWTTLLNRACAVKLLLTNLLGATPMSELELLLPIRSEYSVLSSVKNLGLVKVTRLKHKI